MKINNIASDRDLAKMIVGLTDKMDLDAVICLTEKGGLAGELQELNPDVKIIAATAVSRLIRN